VSGYLARAISFVRRIGQRLFRRPSMEVSAATWANETERTSYVEVSTPVTTSSGAATKPNETNWAAWEFRGQILDRLDDHFKCMRHLRKGDPEAYALYSRVGFSMAAEFYKSGRIGAERPSFGGIYFPKVDESDNVMPSFSYFQKISHPPRVEACAGDVYRFVGLYDDRSDLQAFLECHVEVSPSGDVRLLREARIVTSSFDVRRGRRKQKLSFSGCQWVYPQWTQETEGNPVEWFCIAFNTHCGVQSQIVVRASLGREVAAFGINLKRAPKFFADRGTELAADGKRKRIFHSVSSHSRRISEDRTLTVKSHYRGVRHFDWKGYGITIVMPGALNLTTFNAPAVEMDDADVMVPQEWLPSSEVGRRIQEVLEA